MELLILIGFLVLVFALIKRRGGKRLNQFVGGRNWPVIWQESPEQIGNQGEAAVARRLNKLPEGKYVVLNDILLVSNNNSTQIDHIVVSCYGIFVIETKNIHGKVYGSENAEYWTQYLPDVGYKRYGFTQEHKLRNPIIQNNGHVKALRRLLTNQNVPIYGLVAFSNEADLRVRCDYPVMYWYDVVPFIEDHTDLCMDQDKVESIANMIESYNHTGEEARSCHIANVLDNMARRDSMVSAGRCPQCGGQLVQKNGKYGQFWGCSNYPNCKYILRN